VQEQAAAWQRRQRVLVRQRLLLLLQVRRIGLYLTVDDDLTTGGIIPLIIKRIFCVEHIFPDIQQNSLNFIFQDFYLVFQAVLFCR